MILNDCEIGDVVWIVNYEDGEYIKVRYNGPIDDDENLVPQTLCQSIESPDLFIYAFSIQECWKERPGEKPRLKYHTTFRELWDRFEWPDYQEYQDKPGFDNNSVYDAKNNTYFIKVDWLKSL